MGVDNTYCMVFVLGLVLFLAPMEQASAIFYIPTEITQEESTESYLQKEISRLEQLRNEIYGSKHNPYDDIKIEEKTSNNQILDNYSPNSIEYFQKVIEYIYKVKQINLATQKLDEILGGKSTANSDFYKTKFITSSTSKSLVDNQTSSVKRTDESFQNYKDEQIVALEKIRDELMEQNRFFLNQKTYEIDITKISDKKLNAIKKQLEKFELNIIKIKEIKYDIKESHENQIKESDEQYNEQKVDVITSYENQIKESEEQYNEQKVDVITSYENKIKELEEQYNAQKVDVITSYENKIKELEEQYNAQKVDVITSYENQIKELEENDNKIEKSTTNYENKIQKLDDKYNNEIEKSTTNNDNKIKELDDKYNNEIEKSTTNNDNKIKELDDKYNNEIEKSTTNYKNKIQKLDDKYNNEIEKSTTNNDNKIKELDDKLGNSDPKIPKLIAIKLKNEERAIPHNLVTRDDSEFTNLMESELLLAEKTRANIMDLTIPGTLNPYIIENITNAVILLENASTETVIPVETTKINLVLSWLDQNVVLELQATNLNRISTNFEDFKLMQVKLAQIELNKMLHVENSENTEPSDSEQADIVISDGPFFNSYNNGDFLFEFSKNMQKMKAEKKFIEMYGNKIQNKDFYKTWLVWIFQNNS